MDPRPGLGRAASVERRVRRVVPIVALDVSDEASARGIVDALGDLCRFYKVGPELFATTGPAIVWALTERGCRVFLDLKFYDIPNTVRGGCRSAARAGAHLVTVHATGGVDMMRAAVEGAREGGAACEVLAVTVLTSFDSARLAAAWARPQIDISTEVLRLTGVAREAGAAGVVCGGAEVSRVREAYGESLSILVPGVRLRGSAVDDQQRVTTASDAAASGATYIVLGRTVTQASDVRAAMQRVQEELASAS